MDLSRCRLYGILDLSYVEVGDAPSVAGAMIEGGVDLMQLRAKRYSVAEITAVACKLHELISPHDVPLVINDHPEIVRSAGAEGVHVGQDDASVAEARRTAGERCLVGRSTHSIEQALRAEEDGADYIGFGPLFATPTKPEYNPIGLEQIAVVHRLVRRPIFCIGGIKLENLPEVIAAGARRVVIVSGLLQAPDIASYARATRKLLEAV